MRPDLLLGIDAGTGGTKAALYDLEGSLRGAATVPSRLHRAGPGHVEQDPREMEEELAAAVRGALADAGATGGDVAALACDGQMAGIMFVDAAGDAVGPYDSWLDTRCDPDVQTMRAHAARVIELTGGYPTYSHGPKLLWWARERREDLGRAVAMVMPGSFLAGRLAGLRGRDAFIDPTYLHFSCLADTRAEAWSSELATAFDVPERLLPRILEPTATIGEVTREAAAATGLRAGTLIAAGCGDTAAGLLGAGVVRPGVALDVAGSASVLATCVGAFRPDAGGTLFTARTALPDVYYALAYVQGGGLNLGWFRDTFARDLVGRDADGAFEALDAEAAAVPPLADGVAFVPHLGGRVTPNDPYLRGTLTGFGWRHGRGHAYRAVLEGVALEYGLYLRAVRAAHPDLGDVVVRAVGGGARSAVWGQMKADVLGAPYLPLERQEGGALGSALVAGCAAGLVDDLAAFAERSNATAGRYDPDPHRHALYGRGLDAYAELLSVASDLGRRRSVREAGP